MDNQKRTKELGDWPPQEWKLVSRPVLPYGVLPVEIVRGDKEHPEPSSRSPRHSWYVLDPIHPEVLALNTAEPETFVDFVARLGLIEFLQWVFDDGASRLAKVWRPIRGSVASKHPSVQLAMIDRVDYDFLVSAWSHPVTVEAFSADQALLQEAMSSDNPREVLGTAYWRDDEELLPDRFPTKFGIDPVSGIMYERPRHIMARAWLEVLDAVESDTSLKVCAYCRAPFYPPTRSDQVYCPGRPCADRAHRKEYDQTPYRKEYQRMHKRWKRGSITDEAWEQWKTENQQRKA